MRMPTKFLAGCFSGEARRAGRGRMISRANCAAVPLSSRLSTGLHTLAFRLLRFLFRFRNRPGGECPPILRAERLCLGRQEIDAAAGAGAAG